jgi:hypothetical protein
VTSSVRGDEEPTLDHLVQSDTYFVAVITQAYILSSSHHILSSRVGADRHSIEEVEGCRASPPAIVIEELLATASLSQVNDESALERQKAKADDIRMA